MRELHGIFLKGLCKIKVEDCGDDAHDPPHTLNLFTPPEHNVGERYAPSEAFSASPLLRSLFPGEHAWIDAPFCGGQEVIVSADIPLIDITETCAGGLFAKWLPAFQLFFPAQRRFTGGRYRTSAGSARRCLSCKRCSPRPSNTRRRGDADRESNREVKR